MESLRQKTELLNALLENAQGALIRLNLGVRAKVPLDEATSVGTMVDFGFGKVNAEWGFFLEADGETRLLLSSARHLRVQAAHALPRLLAALDEKVQEDSQDIDDACAATRAFMAEIHRREAQRDKA